MPILVTSQGECIGVRAVDGTLIEFDQPPHPHQWPEELSDAGDKMGVGRREMAGAVAIIARHPELVAVIIGIVLGGAVTIVSARVDLQGRVCGRRDFGSSTWEPDRRIPLTVRAR